uniref:Proteinase inhibitor I42 chagasin domain-containing protein n=1 Tax=Euplotes harpa TaxID=151035 RepID=A0A7S3NFW3_9SPIT|mmetsp:Transcript_7093/g.8050  ORF Transcript_7093/g.8050 Transcript_7093/m.8050 type:complete len:151 (+) Transcript_7093:38-490(+)
MRHLVISLLLVLFISSSMCEKKTFTFKSTENGALESLNVKIGDEVEITLDENPTTGYQWMIPEYEEGYNYIWSLKESTYTSAPNQSGMVGVGGKRTFILNVNLTGNEIVTFVYGRPWLYPQAIQQYNATGVFDASIMEGIAIQLELKSTS